MDSNASTGFQRGLQRALIIGFLALSALPGLGLVFHLDAPRLNEKRKLAEAPVLSLAWRSSPRFVSQLQAYLADNFGFRSTLVRWNARFSARSLALSPTPNVVMGKQGWLFYGADHSLEDYRCLQPFTETQLQQWTSMLERRQAWLRERGCRYLFFVAPNEHTIYPEFLPGTVTRVRDCSRLDQLLAYVRAHSTVPVLDLRPALLAAKSRERVYQKTDTHWNERGAFAAYQALGQALTPWFPGLKPAARETFVATTSQGPGGDLADLLGMADGYQEEVLGLRPLAPRLARFSDWSPQQRLSLGVGSVRESALPGPAQPRVVMFHDSFGEALLPFLAEHFTRGVFVLKPMGFDLALLEREKPDLVLQELVERSLWGDYSQPFF